MLGRGKTQTPELVCVDLCRERLLIFAQFPKGPGTHLEYVVGPSGHRIGPCSVCSFSADFSGQESRLLDSSVSLSQPSKGLSG